MFQIATPFRIFRFGSPAVSGILAVAAALLLFVSASSAQDPARQDAAPVDKVHSLDAGFRQMYNLDFAAAHQTFQGWEQQHPEDPLGPAANAAAHLFGEFERLRILDIHLFTDPKRLDGFKKAKPDPEIKAAFEGDLDRADRMASRALGLSPQDPDALFARVLTQGLRGYYVSLIEKKNSKALDHLKSSRSTAQKLLATDPTYYDAQLAIGVENYLLGLRSAPVRWFLKMSGAQTNKDRGIANLKITAAKGRFLAPFARLLLAIAALRDKDPATARGILTALVEEFPQNRLYQSELARLQGAGHAAISK